MNGKKTVTLVLVLVVILAGALPAMARRGGIIHRMGGGAVTLEKLDENGDGIVTLEDFVANRTARWDARFDALDQNGDGAISQAEYDVVSSVGFRRMHRGFQLDQTAFEQCMKSQLGEAFEGKPTWENLAAFDSNEDGMIDEIEFLTYRETHATERFSEIDSNGDDVLEETELETYIPAMQERREAHRACMMEQLEL